MRRRSFFKSLVAIYGLLTISSNAKESDEIGHNDSLSSVDKFCIIGIGGGGTNIVNDISRLDGTHMFIHINSDYNSLMQKKSKHKILLGWEKKAGLGCGGKAECGESLIDKDVKNELSELTRSMETVYVIASLGGGVGSGATPKIVEHLKSLNKKVIVFVTIPFSFEGNKRMTSAKKSMENILKHSDKLVVYNNDTLLHYSEGVGIKETFELISKVFYTMIKT